MKKNILKICGILVFLAVLTGCPHQINNNGKGDKPGSGNELTLTQKIAAAQTSIDFENAKISEDAVVSKAIVIKNLNLDGKKLVLEASGIELQNVKNAVIIVDQKVGEGDVTLTECSSISKLEINGGGANSIHINKSSIANVQVKKNNVRIALEESSTVEEVVVEASSTKIESEENIVIKAISVNDNVDTITVKGGTVNKIEVVPVEAAPATPGQTEPAAEKTKIVIDGKTEVKSVEGTKDVQLTKEAIESGSNVVINAPVPVVTYYDSTVVFLSNGNLEGTEFENEDVYYEYIFDLDMENEQIMSMDPKIKLYKLPDDIKLYIYMVQPDVGPATMEMPDNDTTAELKKYDTFSFSETMYSATLTLKSAGLIKGSFSQDRAILEPPVYDYEFDIKDCGFPEEIILPDTPYKPQFTVTPSSQGNIITFTFNDSNDAQTPDKYISETITVYRGVKEDGKWVGYSKNFVYEMKNNKQKTVTFIDSFVTPGNEYAYCYDVDRTSTLYKNEFETVTANGGNGEINITAENSTTDNGIKLTVSDSTYSDDYILHYSIFRYYENDQDENPCYASITNYINETETLPIVDYYTESGTSYVYKLDYKYCNQVLDLTYYPKVNSCTITATVGLGEPKITNKPTGSVSDKVFTLTTVPQIGIEQLHGNATYQVNLNYVKTVGNNSSIETICYDANRPISYDISNWNSGTYQYQYYYVSISYHNSNNNSGISYNYVYHKDSDFPGMLDITIE
ncbi:MAG: hypothetical protein J5726_06790 [Treponema sp.]|nr:hypothetical protein [Treponema sp.]